jgi:secreted trypsin-like serine protease
VALSAALWLTGAQAVAAGNDNPAKAKVAGGYFPDRSFAPWTTFIENSGGGFCTASLISPKRVLTAAHCVVDDKNPRHWVARVGTRNRAVPEDGETHQVTGIAIHPKVSLPDTGVHTNHAFYDLAVMFLKRKSRFLPARIGNPDDWYQDDWPYGVAIGWGHYNYDHDHPLFTPRVKAINLSLGSDSECAGWINSGGTQHYFPSIHICAYDYEGDDCITHGDSGGPLMVYSRYRWRPIGVTSFFPGQQSWGPCDGVSMVGFAWVAGETLRFWPGHVQNPACGPATRRWRKVRREVRRGIITTSSGRYRKARKQFRTLCRG